MQSPESKCGVDAITKPVIASAYVQKQNRENLFLRVDALLKERWDKMCEARKISSTDAGAALVEWIVGQEPETQAMILGVIPARTDLIEMVLRRENGRLKMAAKPRRSRDQEANE